jgi:hypothetical protein
MSFAQEKMQFFTDMRKNGLVQEAGAERAIRSLFEDMELYVEKANLATHKRRHAFQKVNIITPDGITAEEKEELESTCKALGHRYLDKVVEPYSLDIRDAKVISYSVGMNGFGFMNRKPLDFLEKEVNRNYGMYRETETINSNFLDLDVILKGDSSGIEAASNSYKKRTWQLMRLAKAETYIQQHMDDDLKEKLKRGFTANDWSWVYSWRQDSLSKKGVRYISSFFSKQAEINATMLKTFHLAGLRQKQAPDAVQQAEKDYDQVLKAIYLSLL